MIISLERTKKQREARDQEVLRTTIRLAEEDIGRIQKRLQDLRQCLAFGHRMSDQRVVCTRCGMRPGH